MRYYDQFADLFCPELYPRIHFLLPEMESLHETKNGKIGSSLQSRRAHLLRSSYSAWKGLSLSLDYYPDNDDFPCSVPRRGSIIQEKGKNEVTLRFGHYT